ncbi:unnamed protein product [Closterium sp. NIES-65]|nr:unnamed protein product [Closterium sp. NIES-65]
MVEWWVGKEEETTRRAMTGGKLGGERLMLWRPAMVGGRAGKVWVGGRGGLMQGREGGTSMGKAGRKELQAAVKERRQGTDATGWTMHNCSIHSLPEGERGRQQGGLELLLAALCTPAEVGDGNRVGDGEGGVGGEGDEGADGEVDGGGERDGDGKV